MNGNIKANIINHDKLCYGMGFITEMVLLIDGPKKAHKQIKKLIAKGVPAELMEEPFDVPADDGERYQRALELVNAIGRAAGEELNEIGHEGDIQHLYRIFREGSTSNSDRKVVGSSLEKVFFDCGLGAGTIIFNVVKPDTEKKLGTLLSEMHEAFKLGVEEEWAA